MARYIDLYDHRNCYIGEDGEYQKWNIDPEVIEEAADVVEVVRCKDCKHYLNSNEKCELIDTRLHFYEADKVWTADCFCAWAERRTE